jgi:Tol biopolymer transport system component
MKKMLSSFVVIVFFAASMSAQDLPVCNIYLFKTTLQDTTLMLSEPQFLTVFNKSGYNNQPAFLNNNELLIASAGPRDNQTDIYLLDLQAKSRMRMTRTAESEFSPKPTPDNLYFSVVRVEMDADRSQRLWQYPLDRQDEGKPSFRFLRGVGYYHWLDKFKVALFNVTSGNSNYLSMADTRDAAIANLSPNVGRCFGISPNGRLVFVHKINDENWVIKALDKNSLETTEITKAIPGAEDFVVMKDGAIVMGKGSRLYRYHPVKGKKWQDVADLKKQGITNITRMAVSSDGKLAIVNGG